MLRRLFGIVGWLGAALVFAAVAVRLLRPEWTWYQPLAMAGLACTLLYILSQWREIGRSFSGRSARYGTLAVASALVVLGILVAINYLASRHNKRWDLTAARQFSLSEQTRRVLQGLDEPVQIRVFARSEDFERFRDRLDEYQYVSDRVQVEYIDAERRPALANQYQVQTLGTIVLEYAGRTERVTSEREQDITNGLIKVVQGTQHKVYFTQGHGERSPDDSDRGGFGAIAAALRSDNFAVERVVLAQQGSVPEDASVLVVAGPKTDFLPGEVEMLRRYLARGGKVLFLLDPPDTAEAPAVANLEALLREWAVQIGTNVVVDVSGVGQILGTDASVPVAARYQPHQITERFDLITAYPLARSVSPVEGGVDGRYAQSLVETSPSSWAESDIRGLTTTGRVTRDLEKGDTAGPISLAAAVSAPAPDAPPQPEAETGGDAQGSPPAPPQTRIAVFGDSDFATNAWLGIRGNRDLLLNAVSWLAQQEDLIAIRPRDPEDRRITLTAEQERWIFLLTVFIIPGLILLAGVQVWWRRR